MTAPKEIIQVAAMFKRKLPNMKKASRKEIVCYLLWHMTRASIAVVRDAGGKIIAAGTFRPIAKIEDAREQYKFEEGAAIVYAENSVACRPDCMAGLLLAAKHRCPTMRKIARRRHGRMIVSDFNRYFHLNRKLAYGR